MKTKHLLLAVAVGFALSDLGLAQEPRPAQPEGGSEALAAVLTDSLAQEPARAAASRLECRRLAAGFFEALPRPRDLPRSLFAPAVPNVARARGHRWTVFPVPDPLLDPPFFPPPGWFAGAEAQIVKPHLLTRMEQQRDRGQVRTNNASGVFPMPGHTSIVNLPSANLRLDRRSPRFCGLPPSLRVRRIHGGLPEPGNLRQRGHPGYKRAGRSGHPVRLDMIDLDYNSRELSLWPQWDMKWSVGLRNLFINWAAQGTQPFTQAPAGGVFQAQNSTTTTAWARMPPYGSTVTWGIRGGRSVPWSMPLVCLPISRRGG